MTYVQSRTSRPPSPRHHVAGPSDCGAPTRRPGGRAAVGQGRRRQSGLQNRASLTTLANFSLSELWLGLRDSATVTRWSTGPGTGVWTMPVQYGRAGPGRDLGLVLSVLEVHSPCIGLTEFERRRGRAGAGPASAKSGGLDDTSEIFYVS